MAQSPNTTCPKVASSWLACFLVATVVFLYFHLFVSWAIPIRRSGDEAVFLSEALRMLEGQVIYRDFFEFMLPGTQMVYLVAFRLLGVQAWIPNLVLVWLGVGMVWVSVVIARKLWRGWPVFLPGLLFLTFAFRTRPDASHHWYSSLASLAATAVLIEKRTPARLAAAGALCGLASWFTQTRGAAAVLGLLVFLWWDERTKSDCCHWPFRSGRKC